MVFKHSALRMLSGLGPLPVLGFFSMSAYLSVCLADDWGGAFSEEKGLETRGVLRCKGVQVRKDGNW